MDSITDFIGGGYKEMLGRKEDVCEFCNGTKEVSVDESDGEGHITRGTGTRKCICALEEQTEDNLNQD